MENAIIVSNLHELNFVEDKYTRVYFGHEFCPHLMLSLKEVKKIICYCEENKKDLTLVTPYMTEKGMEEIIEVLRYLCENKVKCELVINDWGLLYYINSYYPGIFDLILGRLLNKIKRSPVVMNYIGKLKPEAEAVLRSPSGNLSPSWAIMEKYGIKRVVFDNVLQGNSISENFPFKADLFYPYVFITTARRCITDFVVCGREDYDLNSCSRACFDSELHLYNKIVGRNLILKGSTYYFRNDNLPENIDQFSRIVWNHLLIG